MIGQVKTINGIKQIVPITGEGIIDSVAHGSMLPVTSNAVSDAISSLAVATKSVISTNTSEVVYGDTIYFIDTSSVTLTLEFNSTNTVKAEVYALENCTVTYYTDSTTALSLSMLKDTYATFVYFNGWKYNGVYGAVWN